jgi:hypothetical protein
MATIYQTPRSDPDGWRLVVGEDSHGQQKWVYLPEGPARKNWKQNKETKYWMGLDIVSGDELKDVTLRSCGQTAERGVFCHGLCVKSGTLS